MYYASIVRYFASAHCKAARLSQTLNSLADVDRGNGCHQQDQQYKEWAQASLTTVFNCQICVMQRVHSVLATKLSTQVPDAGDAGAVVCLAGPDASSPPAAAEASFPCLAASSRSDADTCIHALQKRNASNEHKVHSAQAAVAI